MKNNSLIIASAAALVSIVAVSGIALSTFASTTDAPNTANGFMGGGRHVRGPAQNLTDEQKTAFEAKRTEFEATREAKRAEMETAMQSGFDAWSALVKKNQGDTAPILQTITADKFAKFKEGHDLMSQGRKIMDDLGLKGEGMGMGGGRGHGMGFGRGMMDFDND